MKVGRASEAALEAADAGSSEGGATVGLLSDYSVAQATANLRTPRTPAASRDLVMEVRILYYC